MSKVKNILIGSAAIYFVPAVVFAQISDINSLVNVVIDVLNQAVIPLIIALAVVVIIWGIFQYLIAGGDEDRKAGRDKIIYGIVGLFVMVSIWGLVAVLTNTFNFGSDTPVEGPDLPRAGS